MLGILDKRSKDAEAMERTSTRNSTPNRLAAATLSAMFEARKEAKSERELRDLAKLYRLDWDLFLHLTTHFNSPSVIGLPSKEEEQQGIMLVSLSEGTI